MSAVFVQVAPLDEGGSFVLTSPSMREGSFQAVEGGEAMHSGPLLLLSAYAVLWALLLFWILRLSRMQTRLSVQIARVEKALRDSLQAPVSEPNQSVQDP